MRGSPLLFSVQGWVWPCCRETLIPNCAPWEQMVCFLFTKSSQWWAPAAAWPGMENLFGATCPQEGRRQADWVGELQPPSCQSHPLAGWALTCKGTHAQPKANMSLVCAHIHMYHTDPTPGNIPYMHSTCQTHTPHSHTHATHIHTRYITIIATHRPCTRECTYATTHTIHTAYTLLQIHTTHTPHWSYTSMPHIHVYTHLIDTLHITVTCIRHTTHTVCTMYALNNLSNYTYIDHTYFTLHPHNTRIT